MASTISVSRTIHDEEPSAFGAVTVDWAGSAEDGGVPTIRVVQGTDRIYMTPNHARAVHEALGIALAGPHA